jgi:hypothetical protein
LKDQAVRTLPVLFNTFPSLAVYASSATDPSLLQLFAAAGALTSQLPPGVPDIKIGQGRRSVLELGLESASEFLLYCDGDRALHWAERYPQELAAVSRQVQGFDFTVLGRTSRAYATHPSFQRDTEVLFNRLFTANTGLAWDVGAGARGLSRRAARAILAGCPDTDLSVDISWPLFLRRAGRFSLGHLETEGLEYETADRFGPEIAAAGGYKPWLAELEKDPRQWLVRLEVARKEIEALLDPNA